MIATPAAPPLPGPENSAGSPSTRKHARRRVGARRPRILTSVDLPGAVLTDQRVRLAAVQRDRPVDERPNGAEGLDRMVQFEQRPTALEAFVVTGSPGSVIETFHIVRTDARPTSRVVLVKMRGNWACWRPMCRRPTACPLGVC